MLALVAVGVHAQDDAPGAPSINASALFTESVSVRDSMAELYDVLNQQTADLQQALEVHQFRLDLLRTPVSTAQLARAHANLRDLEEARTHWIEEADAKRLADVNQEIRLARAIVQTSGVTNAAARARLELEAEAAVRELREEMLSIASQINKERQALARTAQLYEPDFARIVPLYCRAPTNAYPALASVAASGAFRDTTMLYIWLAKGREELATAEVTVRRDRPRGNARSTLPGRRHVIEYEDDEGCRIRAGDFQVDFVFLSSDWTRRHRPPVVAHDLMDLDALSMISLERPEESYPGIAPDESRTTPATPAVRPDLVRPRPLPDDPQ